MSHISEMKTVLRDPECIIQALVDQGFKREEIETHNTPVDIEGGGKGNIVVRMAAIQRLLGKSPYTEMGFAVQPDGTYGMLYDEWHFKKEWGATLTQRYNRAFDLKKAKAGGWIVSETRLDSGAIKLTLRR